MHNEVEGYYDETENYRRERQAELNAAKASRQSLEQLYGQVWSTDELSSEFSITGFAAPFVVVKHLTSGKAGSLEFQHSPRFYFNFQVDDGK